jgi:hypothetical protein
MKPFGLRTIRDEATLLKELVTYSFVSITSRASGAQASPAELASLMLGLLTLVGRKCSI